MKRTKIIIGLAIAIILVVAASYFVLGDRMFSEQNEFGDWGQEVILNYADGSTRSLGILATNPLQKLTYERQTVVSITYKLSCKATGEGYQAITIDMSQHTLTIYMDSIAFNPIKNFPNTIQVPVDGQWHVIHEQTISVLDFTSGISVGDHTLKLVCGGTLRYQVESGNWLAVANPTQISIPVIVTADAWIQVDLSQDIEFRNEKYEINLVIGQNNISFPAEIWQYSESIKSDSSCKNFITVAGIYNSVSSIFTATGDLKSWVRDRPEEANTFHIIEPNNAYIFYITQACTLTINYDSDSNQNRFERTLYFYGLDPPEPDEWNVVELPATIWQRNSSIAGDSSVNNVFSSVWDHFIIVEYYDGTNWFSYSKARPINDLSNIVPGTYYVRVNQECTLIINYNLS